MASFVGAHVSLEGRARFGTCLGKRSNGGSRSESCWNGGAALDETATDAARADGATPGVAGAKPRAPRVRRGHKGHRPTREARRHT